MCWVIFGVLDILVWFFLIKKAIFNTCISSLPSLGQYTIFKMVLSLNVEEIQDTVFKMKILNKNKGLNLCCLWKLQWYCLECFWFTFKSVFCWPFPFMKPFSVWLLRLIPLKTCRALWSQQDLWHSVSYI